MFNRNNIYSQVRGIHVINLVGLRQDPGLLNEGDQVVVAGLQVPATLNVAENVPPCLLVDRSRLNYGNVNSNLLPFFPQKED